MSSPRAALIDDIVAVLMHIGHVLPPDVSGTIISIGLLVKALFSQILEYDVTTLDVFIAWLHSTVLAPGEAIILKIFFLTESTLPEHVSGGHEDLVAELLVILLEIRDEIESAVIGGSKPDVILNSIIWLVHDELCHDGCLIKLLFTRSLKVIYQLATICLPDQHRGDADPTTGTIITHNDTLYIFLVIINDDCDCYPNVLHVAYLLHK